MGTSNLDVTENKAFNNVLSSMQLLHEYMKETKDETTFALFIGGALDDETTLHCVGTGVGDLSRPHTFDAAVKTLVNSMGKIELLTKLIIEAYHTFVSKGNVKVVKFSVDNPEDVLTKIKHIMADGDEINLADLPPELLESIMENMPSELREMLSKKRGSPCDHPTCPICVTHNKKGDKGN